MLHNGPANIIKRGTPFAGRPIATSDRCSRAATLQTVQASISSKGMWGNNIVICICAINWWLDCLPNGNFSTIYHAAWEGRSCERSGGYTTINRIPLPLFKAKLWINNCSKFSIISTFCHFISRLASNNWLRKPWHPKIKSLLATFLRPEQNWSLGHALSHYAIRIGLEQISEEADICRESMES